MRFIRFVHTTTLLVAGCAASPEAPRLPEVARVQIIASPALVELGAIHALTARASGVDGAEVASATVSWTSRDPGVATIDSSGAVTAISAGTADIVAAVGPVSASTTIRVVAGPPVTTACQAGPRVVALLVDAALSAALDAPLAVFARDLCASGYTVLVRRASMPDAGGLRAWLRGRWVATAGHLAGAIVVGDPPRAYQLVTAHSANPSIPATTEEAISLQYFQDLDGRFSASPDYRSPGGHQFSYDRHDGDTDWEIWVGVLPMHKDGLAKTEEALNRYFARNHAYRAGILTFPRALLQVNELFVGKTNEETSQFLALMRDGPYAWKPASADASAQLYVAGTIPGTGPDDGYARLATGTADFFVGDAHGSWQFHGKLSAAWADAATIRVAFFWSSGCSVGDLDRAGNFLASVLYGRASMVLVAKGTTNSAAGMGNNREGFYGANVISRFAAGTAFGDAVLGHANVPLVQPWLTDREFLLGTSVILGDPTLTRR